MFRIPKKFQFFGSPSEQKTSCQILTSVFFYGLSAVLLVLLGVSSSEGASSIPPLKKIIPLALAKKQTLSDSEIVYQVKKRYYQVQYKTNQLGVAEEVRKRFTTAIEKSEERFDKDQGEVAQSDIIKLKLGLSGALNDVIRLENEIHLGKLALAGLTGLDLTVESKLEEDTILPLKFPAASFEKVFGKKYSFPLFDQKKLLLKVREERDKMQLALDGRKMTRALLVTEAANYDFGVGDSEDLFQALIIYTRVLSDYYESVYNFNAAAADLIRELNSKKILGSEGKTSPR